MAEAIIVIVSPLVLTIVWLVADRQQMGKEIKALRRAKGIEDTVNGIWLPTVHVDAYNRRVELIDTIARTYPKD